jgi:hypothetical protein
VSRSETRRDRLHQFGGARLREAEHPRECRVSGIIETSMMMDRFSGGGSEGRERVIAQEPVGRMESPRR